MTDAPRYLLDANVFIEASRGYYAFDIVPAFWQALISQASDGRLLSIDRVKHELERGKDDLATWASGSFHRWFMPTIDPDVVQSYAQVMRWARAQAQYSEAAKAEFAESENADAWLIAYALAKSCIIVTSEQPAPNSKRKIKIPDVARAFGIPFIDTYGMLRALRVTFG